MKDLLNPWVVSGLTVAIVIMVLSLKFLKNLKLEEEMEDFILNEFIISGNHMPIKTAVETLSEKFRISCQEVLRILEIRIVPKKILIKKKIQGEICFVKPQ